MTTAPALPPDTATADPSAPAPLPPLKPRPALLALTSIAFAVWIIFMVVLYVTTVYPERHPAKQAGQAVEKDR